MAGREPISTMVFLKSTFIGGHFSREILDLDKNSQVEIFKSFIWDTRKFSFSTSEALLRKNCKLFKRNVMLRHLSY